MLLANALLDLGRSRYALEEYDDALAAYEERLEILRSLPESDPQGEGVTLHDIADVHEARGDLPRAAALLRDAVDHKRRGGEIPRDLGVSLLALGRALVATEDLADAVAAFEERVAILRSLPEPEHHSEAVTLHELGAALGQAGRHAEAIDALRQAEALERESGEEEELAFTLLALGRVLRRSGDGGAALDAFEERLGILDSGAEPDGRAEATTLQEIAETLVELERPAEAVARYEEAIARHRELAGNLDGLAVLLFGAANLRLGLRDLDQARSLAEESVELLRVDPEPDPMQLSAALMTLGDATMRAGESQRAVPLLEESHRLLVDAGADPIELAILGRRLAAAYSATGREQDSRRYQENARAALAEGLDEGVKNPTMLPMLATIAAEVGAPELVERLIDEARASAAEDPAGARGQSLLVDVLRSAGWGYETAAEPAAAIGPYSERLAILEGLPERDMEAEGRARRDLGDVHRDLGESAAAIAAYRQAADCLRESGHRFAAATCQRYLAEVQAEEGDHAGALTTLAERLTLLGEEPEGDERRRLELATFEHIARSHLAAGSEGEARKAVEEAQRVLAEGGEADEEIAAGLRELAAELGLD
jgi:tetratricopeptide (TPR) repeat protein